MSARQKLIHRFGASPFGDGVVWEAHHIIPLNDLDPELSDFLEKIGFDKNSVANLVPLPKDETDASTLNLPRHSNHFAEYRDLVEK